MQRFDVVYADGSVERRISNLSKTQARDQLQAFDEAGVKAWAAYPDTGAPVPRCTCGFQGGCYVPSGRKPVAPPKGGRVAYRVLFHALDGFCGLCDDPHLTR